MRQCFISHCSDDLESIVGPLEELLSYHFDNRKYKFFCSSTSNNVLNPGESVSNLKNRLKKSVCMIAVVTDSYLRSPISLTEFSAMWFSRNNDSVIPIAYSKEGQNYLKQEFISNIVYLDATDNAFARRNAELFIKALRKNGFHSRNEQNLFDSLVDFFSKHKQVVPSRPYIGSGKTYENINRYCESRGIKRFTNGAVEVEVITKKLADKTDLYFVMTTGSGFIETYSKEFLPERLAVGTNIYMIIPNRKSDFCRDLALIESLENADKNLDRLTDEFDKVVKRLKFIILEAEAIAKSKSTKRGHVYLCSAYTLLRQTIGLGKNNEGKCWGWMTTTIPPVRAIGKTPTIIFEGSLSKNCFLGKSIFEHINRLIEVSRSRNGIIELDSKSDFKGFDRDEVLDLGERIDIENSWEKKYTEALGLSKDRKELCDRVLIEIAAQHPLSGDKPGEEFKARLDYGYHLYQSLLSLGKVVDIYVPGSIHQENGIVDSISLSKAGCNYLASKGVPEQHLYGEEENERFMGDYGVYNSCDECYVASMIFKQKAYGILHCVCSPNQVLRKQLFYLNFQIIPVIHTVTSNNMYHHFTSELFHSIPKVIYQYPNWSLPECPIFHSSRNDRMPGYKK